MVEGPDHGRVQDHESEHGAPAGDQLKGEDEADEGTDLSDAKVDFEGDRRFAGIPLDFIDHPIQRDINRKGEHLLVAVVHLR